MAKIVFLIRHAKSSWDSTALSDFDRPLNDRGKKDAPEMARRLRDQQVKIDAFVTSPAKRAQQTCKRFVKVFDAKKSKIVVDEKLYEASEETLFKSIEGFKNKWDHVAIFSHNPGITGFVNLLTGTKVDDMPTCGIFGVKIDIEKWKDFRLGNKEFYLFDYPEN